MKQIFLYKGVIGFKRLYDYGYKQIHMITKEAKTRKKILDFWQQYGLEATKSAFNVKRSTLFYWKKLYKDKNYDLLGLNPKSQRPNTVRKRIVDYEIINEIKRLRTEVCPNLGKEKVKIFLYRFCAGNNLKIISTSTIGRIIKEKRIYHHRQKLTYFGKEKQIQRKKKLRKPKDFVASKPGDLIEIDTIVKFIVDIKRYVLTAVDVNDRFTFAWEYEKANSKNAQDFFTKLEQVFPHKIKAVQTDNGSEFHKYFQQYLKERGITHYWNYPKQPYKNGHIEKYNRTLQEEFIDWNEEYLEEPNQFNQKLMEYLVWYNTQRPHWGLKLLSPVDYLIKNNYQSKMCWTNTWALQRFY
jgi:transposase InsO family protein